MTITYTKTIYNLQSYKEVDGNTDVVFTINWNLNGDDNGITASTLGITTVPYIADQPFTPFADLTEAQVLGWIDTYTTRVAMNQYENTVAQSILAKQQLVSLPPPWVPITPVYDPLATSVATEQTVSTVVAQG
jgi:hypothetical protein